MPGDDSTLASKSTDCFVNRYYGSFILVFSFLSRRLFTFLAVLRSRRVASTYFPLLVRTFLFFSLSLFLKPSGVVFFYGALMRTPKREKEREEREEKERKIKPE